MNYLKIAVMALTASLILTTVPQTVYAQLTKKQEKQLQKERDAMYQKRIKMYNKEGWKLSGGSRTLEVALLEHYAKRQVEKLWKMRLPQSRKN